MFLEQVKKMMINHVVKLINWIVSLLEGSLDSKMSLVGRIHQQYTSCRRRVACMAGI
jgi:hypothetical protein